MINYSTKKLGEVYKKGDILEGADRRPQAARHYIIFLEPHHSGDFICAMLTSKDTYSNNILVNTGYIREIADDGTKFKFQFNNTHFVKGRFIKLGSWGPFTKIGELTKEGIDFVDSETKDLEPELWDDYLERMRKKI